MTILERIKNDSLTARKNAVGKGKDAIESIQSKSLTLLISNINSEMKNRKVETLPDNDVIVMVKKSINNVNDAISKGANGDYEAALKIEKQLLEQYVPAQLSAEQIRDWIADYATNQNVTITPKETKGIMQGLNQQFPGQVDGKMVAEIIKTYA